MTYSKGQWCLLLATLFLNGCDSANFGAGGEQKLKTKKVDDATGDKDDGSSGPDSPDAGDDIQDVDFDNNQNVKKVDLDNVPDAGGNATSVFEDSDTGIRKEIFSFGITVKAPLVDFVFVIDNSVSMKEIITNTASGFDSLASDKVWPERALISVMSTMAGDPSDLKKTHPGIAKYNGIESEPGFLSFVDKTSIANFKATSPGFANRWPLEGCSEKWFKPGDKNASGASCFKAHTQSSNHGVGCEPGVTAVSQLLDKHKGKSQFRKGALVNFIFVSDTHDPGCGNKALSTGMPALATIKSKLESDNVVSGLKFHALAPENNCTGEALYSKSYYTLTDETKGYKQDPCKLNDYSGFIKQMVTEAVKQENGVFVLSKDPKKIIRVVVDGTETTKYDYDANKGTISIPDLAPGKDHKIEITYKY